MLYTMADLLLFPDRVGALSRLERAYAEEAIASRLYYDARWAGDQTPAETQRRWDEAPAELAAAEAAVPRSARATSLVDPQNRR